MKKKLFFRGISGFPMGIALVHVITIMISACVGDGSFCPVTRELQQTVGSELLAVILQTLLCGVMGAGFAMASVIWEMDGWSLARQTGIFFSVACVIMLPIAYAANWMEHSFSGLLSYFGVFSAIFLIVWLAQVAAWKRRIRKMNDSLQRSGGTM